MSCKIVDVGVITGNVGLCRTVGHVVCLNDVVWLATAFTGLKDWWGHSPLHMK